MGAKIKGLPFKRPGPRLCMNPKLMMGNSYFSVSVGFYEELLYVLICSDRRQGTKGRAMLLIFFLGDL
uniref:Uncharacterized protein n=1 Tax=Anguilla anguilla TaxID=7936 RepID=A0A0E9RJZ3_ANGAN